MNHRRVILHKESGQSPGKASDQHDERNGATAELHSFRQTLDRKRRVGIDPAISFGAGTANRLEQLLGRLELRQQTVNRRPSCHYPSPAVLCTSSRISKIEMTGRNRMNRNNRAVNRPRDPTNVAMSHIVGEYMLQAAGMKSRWRLTTTII